MHWVGSQQVASEASGKGDDENETLSDKATSIRRNVPNKSQFANRRWDPCHLGPRVVNKWVLFSRCSTTVLESAPRAPPQFERASVLFRVMFVLVVVLWDYWYCASQHSVELIGSGTRNHGNLHPLLKDKYCILVWFIWVAALCPFPGFIHTYLDNISN
jgi:hypothetical protein